jgi:hypothetical protein
MLRIQTHIIDSSFFELASCSKLSPLYSEVLESTICAHSAESSTLLFLIMFAVSIVGMILVMLRAAMYPCREIVEFSNKLAPVDGCDKDGSSTKASAYDASIESNNQSESAPIDI